MKHHLQLKVYSLNRADLEGFEFLNVISKNSPHRLRYIIKKNKFIPYKTIFLTFSIFFQLSYAISMLGKPRIVLLDEPSTGMDPASKRFLWYRYLIAMESLFFFFYKLFTSSYLLLQLLIAHISPKYKYFDHVS